MNAPDWYISDTHFGHANIIGYANRPFATVEEMDAVLIRNFQERVQPTDVVLWVGDVFLCPIPRAQEILSQLPGRHLLVKGNHDRSNATMTRIGFMASTNELILTIADSCVRVTHKPSPTKLGDFCMHGHTHTTSVLVDRRIHVGVDAWGFRPAHRTEIEHLIASEEAAGVKPKP